jgi:hypothetical protein
MHHPVSVPKISSGFLVSSNDIIVYNDMTRHARQVTSVTKGRTQKLPTVMTIHWKALEHFLMVPLAFRIAHYWKKNLFSDFFSLNSVLGELMPEMFMTRQTDYPVHCSFLPFRIVKFCSVHHLSIYFPKNFGADETIVYYIGLRGEFSEVSECFYPSAQMG